MNEPTIIKHFTLLPNYGGKKHLRANFGTSIDNDSYSGEFCSSVTVKHPFLQIFITFHQTFTPKF